MASMLRIVNQCQCMVETAVSTLAVSALNFVYPPECLLCGQEINNLGFTICEACRTKLRPKLTDECPRCGAPVGPYANLTNGCGQCRRDSFAFDRVIRLGVYDGEMRLACLRAKSAGGNSLARGLAAAFVQEKRLQLNENAIDLTMPVPEHWTRRLLNPHYAAETLSCEVSRQLRVRWSRSILIKRRRTPKQATSPTTARRQQQEGSFQVKPSVDLSGKTILLIDDILTTGSTASAAARVLKRAGAKRVIVGVIAVSPLRK